MTVEKEDSPKLINMDHNRLAGVSEDSPDRKEGGESVKDVLSGKSLRSLSRGRADLGVVPTGCVGPPEPSIMIEHQGWGEARWNIESGKLLASAVVVASVAGWDLELCLLMSKSHLWKSRKKWQWGERKERGRKGRGKKKGEKGGMKGNGKEKGWMERGMEGKK